MINFFAIILYIIEIGIVISIIYLVKTVTDIYRIVHNNEKRINELIEIVKSNKSE